MLDIKEWTISCLIILYMCLVILDLVYDNYYELFGITYLTFLVISGEHMDDKKRYIYYKYILGEKVTLIIDLIWIGLGIYALVYLVIIPWYNIVNNLF